MAESLPIIEANGNPVPPVLLPFNELEKPLSAGGRFTLIPGAASTGNIVEQEGNHYWAADKLYPTESAAYWNPVIFGNTGVTAEIAHNAGSNKRWAGLWACLAGSTKSGYRARMEATAAGSHEFKLILEKWTNGILSSELASAENLVIQKGDILGLTVYRGELRIWTRKSNVWSSPVKATDATYTKGYVGISAAGSNEVTLNNFAAASYTPLLFATRLAERMEPWLTADLERYIIAIATPYEAMVELCEEEGFDGEAGYVPAWGRILNPEICPAKALPYLGQFVGTTIPTTATATEARQLIEKHTGTKRGSLEAIEEAIYAHTKLSKTGQSLIERGVLIERREVSGSENAYTFLVNVTEAEIISEAELKQAIYEQKPGGLMFSINKRVAGWLINEELKKVSEETMTIAETFSIRG